MSLLSVNEIHDGRGGKTEMSQRGGMTSYTRVWRAKTSSPYDDAAVVMYTIPSYGSPLPRRGTLFPSDPRATLKSLNPQNGRSKEGKRRWIITGEYSSERYGPAQTENPLLEAARIEWVTDTITKEIWFDRNGNWIANKAFDPYLPPWKTDVQFWTCTIRKNLMMVPGWIDNYRNAINSDTFMIQGRSFGPGQAKMTRMAISDVQHRNDWDFYTLTMSIQTASKDTFQLTMPNWGYRELVDNSIFYGHEPGTDIESCEISDAMGQKTKQPWPLDADGAAIRPYTLSSLLYNTFDTYPEQPFGALPLR